MNYLQKKKLAFMSIVNQIKGFIRTIIGALPLTLEGCVDENSIIDYKIYGQSVQDGEPTPDNPIEVESVGEKTVNLFNIDSINGLANFDSQLNGYYSILDGVIQSKFGVYGSYTFFQCNVKTLAAGQYVLRCDVSYESGGSVYCGLGFTDKTKIYTFTKVAPSEWTTISYEFELTEDKEIFGIQLQGAGNAENFKDVKCYFKNVMLCKKSDDTGVYEPYGKYKIPVTVSGRNLFDEVEASNVNNWTITSTTGDQAVYDLYLPSGTYTFTNTYIGLPTNSNYSIQIRSAEGTLLRYVCTQAQVVSDSVVTRTLSDGEHLRISIYVPGGNGARNLIPRLFTECISKVLIYEGTYTSTDIPDYEPYHEPITTNIYLDEPLRKVGDYADYVDFGNGKVVREVGVGDLTTVADPWIGLVNTPNQNGYYANYYLTNTLADGKMSKGSNLRGYSNFLPCNTTAIGWNKWNSEQVRFGQDNTAIYIITANQMATKADLRGYISNNGEFTPYIYYILETPTEQSISLPTIPTFKGTSIVSTDTTIQPSNAEIEYYSNAKE